MIQPIRTLHQRLPYPNHTDSTFNKEVLIYDTPEEPGYWEYSDRLRQFDRVKYDQAKAYADNNCTSNTAAWWHAFVGSYYGGQSTLRKITAFAQGRLAIPSGYWDLGTTNQAITINATP